MVLKYNNKEEQVLIPGRKLGSSFLLQDFLRISKETDEDMRT